MSLLSCGKQKIAMQNIEVNKMLYYDDVFYSIQGESTDVGSLCVFVRLWGCPVYCSYCDQPQPKSSKKKISIEGMVSLIRKTAIGCNNVCITGGEPLIQRNDLIPLIYELISLDYKVSIETSGCVPIEQSIFNRNFKYVMDIKCPSSNVSSKNIYENIMYLQGKDELKFVIKDRKDYDFAKQVIKDYPTPAVKLFSPMFTSNNELTIGSDLVEWLKEDRMFNARVQIQMHKVLGVK